MTSLVRNSALNGFSGLARQLGGEPERLLAACEIALDIETREEAFLPYRRLIRLLETCARQLACPDFGMRLADRQGIEILGPLAVAIRHADTVAEAIEQSARYLHVFNPGQRMTVRTSGSDLCLRFEIVLENVLAARQARERALVFVKRLTEMGGDAPAPTRVLFADSRLAPLPVYRRILGNAPLCFEAGECGLDIDAAAMQTSLRRSNRHIRAMASAYMQQVGDAREQPVSVRLREIIRRLLPMGRAHIDAAAEYLHMNRRTLQRRLVDEGSSFSVQLEFVRRELAANYLAEHDMPLSQVAALLGYTEQSALNRACRRWFAATPRAYRHRSMGG